MGKSLIIKGADFSANAVSRLPEGYIELTSENADAAKAIWWKIPDYQLRRDTPADATLFWKVLAGSEVKIQKSADQETTKVAFLNRIPSYPPAEGTDYRPLLANNTPQDIYASSDELVTYPVTEDCYLAVYQNPHTVLPSTLIYKP